jgi:hypothetical protein
MSIHHVHSKYPKIDNNSLSSNLVEHFVSPFLKKEPIENVVKDVNINSKSKNHAKEVT